MRVSKWMRKCCLSPVLAVTIALLPAVPGMGADLPQKEAERLLADTYAIAVYMELKGESDYVGKPQNVLRAALFGAYDAKAGFDAEQEEHKEAGKPPLPANAPLFTVDGRTVTADQVIRRHEDSQGVFKGVPEDFTCFIAREAVELAAPYFTGHKLEKHVAPQEHESLGATRLTDKGYFVGIDGLGDPGSVPVLKHIEPRDKGFVLTGEMDEFMDESEDSKKPGTFRLELAPGDVPGTWKRQYSQQDAQS